MTVGTIRVAYMRVGASVASALVWDLRGTYMKVAPSVGPSERENVHPSCRPHRRSRPPVSPSLPYNKSSLRRMLARYSTNNLFQFMDTLQGLL